MLAEFARDKLGCSPGMSWDGRPGMSWDVRPGCCVRYVTPKCVFGSGSGPIACSMWMGWARCQPRFELQIWTFQPRFEPDLNSIWSRFELFNPDLNFKFQLFNPDLNFKFQLFNPDLNFKFQLFNPDLNFKFQLFNPDLNPIWTFQPRFELQIWTFQPRFELGSTPLEVLQMGVDLISTFQPRFELDLKSIWTLQPRFEPLQLSRFSESTQNDVSWIIIWLKIVYKYLCSTSMPRYLTTLAHTGHSGVLTHASRSISELVWSNIGKSVTSDNWTKIMIFLLL